MVMEVGGAVAGTRWSSTSARPFRRAPGGGLASTSWTSTSAHPFGPAPGAGTGLGYTSGFAAQRAPETAISFDDEKVITERAIEVRREQLRSGEIPSMVLRLRFTDRGSVSKGILDAQVKGLFKKAAYKTSRATSFKPVNVQWRWEQIGSEATGDRPLFVPVVAAGPYAGLRYAGPAFPESLYEPDAETLAKLPNQIWVYTVAVTSANNAMSDADGAQALTILKQAIVNLEATNSYQVPLAVVRGCPIGTFEPVPRPVPPPILKTGIATLALLVAYNMVASHVGSERL
jgi:hypothetical protein